MKTILLFLSCFVLWSCTTPITTVPGPVTPPPTPPVPSPELALRGVSWVIDSIDNEAVRVSDTPTIMFSQTGQVSGTNGCNRFFGNYQSDSQFVVIDSQISTSQIACQGVARAVEMAINEALPGQFSYRLEGESALLTRTDGRTIRLVRGSAALRGG